MNTNTLTREIWNELIAKPHNEKGSYQLSPAKLKLIIEKHLGKPKRKVQILPLRVGETYNTKFQVDWRFKVMEIKKKPTGEDYYVNGYYIGREYLGLCPLNVDRLIYKTV